MIPFHTEITINCPVDQVFSFVSDPESYPKWMSGVVSATPIAPKPIRAGTQVRVRGRAGFWSYDGPMEITEYEPNKRLGIRAAIPGAMEFDGTWVFEPTGDVTRLRSSGEYRLQGLWKLVEPLMAREAKKGEADELKKIKTIVEGSSASARSADVGPNR